MASFVEQRSACVVRHIGQNWPRQHQGSQTRILTAKDTKHGFGRLINLARAELMVLARHGVSAVGVMAVDEFDRLKALETAAQ